METATATATVRASDAYSYDARPCYCKGLPYQHTYADCAHLWTEADIPVRRARRSAPTAAQATRKLAMVVRRRAVARKRQADAERNVARAMVAYERACGTLARATDRALTLDAAVRELAKLVATLP